jgi:predicted chitinase
LKGVELAAFLAQIKHESWDFTRMHEVGDKRYFQKMYDKKYKPAKAKGLGNTELGDGVRYRGRGYMQLTGRDNYRSVGRLLGIDLERNPELAARPDIAARVALLYWKQRVRPKVKDWSNVAEVTRPINSRLSISKIASEISQPMLIFTNWRTRYDPRRHLGAGSGHESGGLCGQHDPGR